MKVAVEAMEGVEEEATEEVEVEAMEVVPATLQSSSMMVEEGVEDMQGTLHCNKFECLNL
jgi:hypothetical protein